MAFIGLFMATVGEVGQSAVNAFKAYGTLSKKLKL